MLDKSLKEGFKDAYVTLKEENELLQLYLARYDGLCYDCGLLGFVLGISVTTIGIICFNVFVK